MRIFFVLALAGALIPVLPAADLVWPGLLGPQRDGWVEHFKIPARWPKQLKKEWSVEVGAGYGTPLVEGQRVYQHARQGEEEVIWCVDLASGKQIWRKSYKNPFKIGGGGERHGKGPKSCPVMADGRLFTLSITGMIHAWDMESGSLLWRKDYRGKWEKGNQPNWGVSTSPIVDGERLIVHLGNDGVGALMAFDVKSGREVWSQGEHGTSYSSPLLVEIAGVRQVVQWNHETLAGVESRTGKLLWEYPAPHRSHNQNMPTPVFHKGRILLGGENRGIKCLEPLLKDGKWSVNRLWHQRKVALDMSTAVINGDHLYGMSHFKMGQIFCLDPRDGTIRWLSEGRVGQNVAFLALEGHVAALRANGELRIIAADPAAYRARAAYRVAPDQTWAPPVLLDSKILIKDLNRLTLWSFGS
ncbi:MAG TPA: serine/threonine protein kinase [Verrucomicrobiales bacterium]|nr:serine/threonine protein kinase [Verrucomicrobiales bacterium]